METNQTNTPPYRSSWIDFLTGQIDRFSGSLWLFYTLVLIGVGALNNVVLWADGALPIGTIDPLFTFGAVYVIYGIGFYHFLSGVAREALHDFYPVIKESKLMESALEHEMTKLPVFWGIVALVIGSIVGYFDSSSSQHDFIVQSLGAKIYIVISYTFGFASLFALLFRTARQLHIVVDLHRQVPSINLFDLSPLRAFSRLTATAGFAVFFVGMISALAYAEESAPSLIRFYIAIVFLGIAIFLIPLISMRAQINKEKKKQLAEADLRIRRILEKVDQASERQDFSKMGEWNTALSVFEREKNILKGISSYPWDPATFKSFISTILLPLLLWWLRTLLEKMM